MTLRAIKSLEMNDGPIKSAKQASRLALDSNEDKGILSKSQFL